VHWTDLQENLNRVPYTQALKLTRSTLERLKSKQSGPWPGSAARHRPTPASQWCSGPGKLPGSTRCSLRSVGAEERPARVFGGSQRRWPRRLVEDGEEALCWAIKRLGEVYGCLRKRPGQLVDGGRERGGELQAAAAAMAGGAARGGARRGNDRLL
jgi:hypothetical protein